MAGVDYVQCDMERGSRCQTAWIPAKYAKIHHHVKLRNGDTWEDGWRVTRVSDRMASAEEIQEAGRQHVGLPSIS